MFALAARGACGAASTSGRGAPISFARQERVRLVAARPSSSSSRGTGISPSRMPPPRAFQSDDGNNTNTNNANANANDKTNAADAGAFADFFVSCSPRTQAALRAIAGDPQGALRHYARDPEVMAALGTALSRGMAPGRRAAIERLLAATADEAQAAADGSADASRRRKDQAAEAAAQKQVPAPGKVVAAMFSDPELARLMADPEVKAALAAARGALLGGAGDAGARRALENRGPKVDRAMELLEARLGRFVGSEGTVDV